MLDRESRGEIAGRGWVVLAFVGFQSCLSKISKFTVTCETKLLAPANFTYSRNFFADVEYSYTLSLPNGSCQVCQNHAKRLENT